MKVLGRLREQVCLAAKTRREGCGEAEAYFRRQKRQDNMSHSQRPLVLAKGMSSSEALSEAMAEGDQQTAEEAKVDARKKKGPEAEFATRMLEEWEID